MCICSFFYNLFKYRFFFIETKLLVTFCDQNAKTFLSNNIDKNKKIVIYGFGPYGEEYFVNFFCDYRIIGVYDADYAEFNSRFIFNPEIINRASFDYVVITVMNPETRKSIVNFLLKKGISKEKIVYINYKDTTDK
ncbi:hypothetical protein SAMN02910357_02506 [Succinivibrio dextrinosolvens]|uniref:hypothetical protein n=1 Tax=Succinivibrio dextrinosolvens TaxID=83771 RepID=UPI0008EAE2AD|nr:hypothetical protein [Succinivibrio dextrinosolvens]SFS90658.1 hypothetical protein SAMN02910357_02506 [Succinivibrio dextrinosolvens]